MPDPNPLTTAQNLRELIESESEAVEALSTMTPAVVDALVDSGLFRLSTPKDLGGLEADVDTTIDVCEELAFADGSVGWAFAQNITVGAYSAYLEPEFAMPVAQARASAGMFAPIGMAHEEKGGFRVSGNYPFGSGSGHAEFMGGAAMWMRDGDIAELEDGALPVIAYILPMERVELKGNWDVMGLCGTGSFDFEVPEQFVERGATFRVFGAKVITGGPLYGIGPVPVGTISSCAFSLGTAKRALHEIAEIAKAGRARMGQVPIREQQLFQRDFGLHTIAVQSARALAHDSYNQAVAAVADGKSAEFREDRVRETKTAATYVTKICKEAVTFAWESSGSIGIRNPCKLQRCFRDICVGAQHMVFDNRSYNELAKRNLGLEPDPF
jgi:alkylation response protein AidB-like acyl-CoA dehydrogenase